MIIVNNENFTVIQADNGFVLTRENIFTSEPVTLGCNDSPDNWKEIDVEEARLIQEELIKNIPDDLLSPEDLIV